MDNKDAPSSRRITAKEVAGWLVLACWLAVLTQGAMDGEVDSQVLLHVLDAVSGL